MAASADKIKELLGNGLSNDVVATAVGVTPAYISQLMSDPQFSAEVVTMRTQTLTAATVRDRTWDGVEDALLGKLAEAVDTGMVYKPMDLLRALSVVNKATRRGVSAAENLPQRQSVVTLNLPTMIVNHYRKNSRGEVVELTAEDGTQQTLVTMPAQALISKLAKENKDNKAYVNIGKFLPSAGREEEVGSE